jgi:nitroreductase
MPFSQLILDRYSVRAFGPAPVSAEQKAAIIEAGRAAPTACNYQPQKIRVFEKPEDLAKLDLCSPCRYGAPLAFLICYDNTVCWHGQPGPADIGSGQVDASIVTTHMMLQAADLGLGSIWIGMFDTEKLRENFNIPENIVPVALLPVGTPAEGSEPFAMHFQRRELGEILI